MKLFDIVWKDVLGFEGLYQISNKGEVKSILRFEPSSGRAGMWYRERILKSHLDKDGYPQVILHRDGKSYTYKIHRLVALTFLENPENLPCINHKDENKCNNDYINLEWCDVKYNNNYNDRQIKISQKRMKSIIQTDIFGNFIARHVSINAAANAVNGHRGYIINCCKGKQKQYKKYKWQYEVI